MTPIDITVEVRLLRRINFHSAFFQTSLTLLVDISRVPISENHSAHAAKFRYKTL